MVTDKTAAEVRQYLEAMLTALLRCEPDDIETVRMLIARALKALGGVR